MCFASLTLKGLRGESTTSALGLGADVLLGRTSIKASGTQDDSP